MVSATAALNARIAPLHHTDSEEKLHRAKAIGRIAYRIARTANLAGVQQIDGKEKHFRELRRGLLVIDLYEPFRLAGDAEFSRLRISYDGKKVFETRWDIIGTFNVILFEEAAEWIGSIARAADPFDTALARSTR